MNYRNITTAFWSDPKIEDDFTPEDKYFYLYLLTNEHTNLCGCYEISMASFTGDTGYTRETIEKLLNRFEYVHNVIKYDYTTKEVLILNWSKYNWSRSEKLITAVIRVAKHIKNDSYREYIYELVNSITDNSIQITDNRLQNTDTDTDVSIRDRYHTDRVSDINKPSLEDVKKYISDNKYNVDPKLWFSFYESKGWKIGKDKMVNWKACIDTWHMKQNNINSNDQNSREYDFDEIEKFLAAGGK